MKGQTISHYKIIEKLGEGGMGEVYKAKDTKLDRDVALKLMSAHMQSGKSAKERFIQEAKAASALDHPNVCTIHEIGERPDGSLFITMAYYDGESLEQRLKRGVPKYEEALDLAIQMAKGLSCAHEYDITHRDIKPGNIMVTERDEVKIVDFGLAKLAGHTQLTQTGSTIGTAGYMSPEQISTDMVDHRSDIFSLGIVLYEMFTGTHPFNNEYYHTLLYSIVNEEPEPVTDVNPELPVELEWIISKALEKNPDDRFQSMGDFLGFLESLKSGSVDPDIIQVHKSSKNKPIYTYAAIASAIIVLIVIMTLWMFPTYQPSIGPLFSQSTVPVSKQIAVLPFLNIGDSPENRAFADGLLETITSKLSQLEQFQNQYLVVPASETRSRDIRNASEARASFGVNLVVTGSVQQLDQGVRVTINLIDAVSLRQIDSKIIDDTFIEKSTLQDNAVFNLANMLDIEIQPEARTILTAGGTLEPGAYEFYLQGLGHLQRFDQIQEIDAAIERFERALKEDSKFALAYAALGDAYLYKYRRTENLDWLESAISNVQKAVNLEERLSPIYTTYGVLLIEKGQYELAHEKLEQALNLNPTNFEAYRARARAFTAQERIKEAEATYQKAIDMKPGYWAGYSELGVFYSRNGRFEEAAEQFLIVTELTPNNAGVYRNLGAIYYYLNRPNDALKAFNKSVEIEPNYGVYSNMGTMYYYDGEYNQAAEMYDKALKLNDSDYLVWSFLASAYKYSSPPQPEKSKEATRRAKELAEKKLEVNPRNPQLMASLASYHIDLGNIDISRKLVNVVINMQPSDVSLQISVGTILEHLGDREGALQWIGKAIENGYPVEEINNNPDPKIGELRESAEFKEIVNKQASKNE